MPVRCATPFGWIETLGGQTYVFCIRVEEHAIASDPGPRQVRLFRNNRNQAIRIPVEFELPGRDAIISREGDRLVITPLRKRGLAALLDSWEPIDEAFPDIDDPPPAPKDIF